MNSSFFSFCQLWRPRNIKDIVNCIWTALYGSVIHGRCFIKSTGTVCFDFYCLAIAPDIPLFLQYFIRYLCNKTIPPYLILIWRKKVVWLTNLGLLLEDFGRSDWNLCLSTPLPLFIDAILLDKIWLYWWYMSNYSEVRFHLIVFVNVNDFK